MEVKFFTDLIEALGKVAVGLKALVQLPKTERETIRRTLDETYRLIDTTLNMVIIRLGDVLLQSSDKGFLDEVARLDNYQGWMQAEREFRLCRSLRVALREMETLSGRIAGAASTKDWDALLSQIKAVLGTEDEVALFIGQRFDQLSRDARVATGNGQEARTIRDALTAFRTSLAAERLALIKQEIGLLETV